MIISLFWSIESKVKELMTSSLYGLWEMTKMKEIWEEIGSNWPFCTGNGKDWKFEGDKKILAEFSFSCLMIFVTLYFSRISVFKLGGEVESSKTKPLYKKQVELHPSFEILLPSSHSDLIANPSPQVSWHEFMDESKKCPDLHWQSFPTRINPFEMSQLAHTTVPELSLTLADLQWGLRSPQRSLSIEKGQVQESLSEESIKFGAHSAQWNAGQTWQVWQYWGHVWQLIVRCGGQVSE